MSSAKSARTTGCHSAACPEFNGPFARWAVVPTRIVLEGRSESNGDRSGQENKKKIVRREYTKADVNELRAHSKARTPLAKIVKLTKRREGSLRQKALKLGISLRHRR
jgi:hypothetical protein